MLEFLRTRWAQGTRTSSFPDQAPEFPERFRGRPSFDPARHAGEEQACPACDAQSSRGLLVKGADGKLRLDVGACLFSPEEATACPHHTVSYTTDHRLAARERDGLVSESGELPQLEALDARMRGLFGRSLRLRSVAAGSCNGCEAELVALGNVVFDMARFGIQFVASPRHADGLVVTGAVSRNMRDALYRTYEATPEPRIVIAVGACAVSGGPFRGSPEVLDGIPDDIPVDLWIGGCPPHPLTVLDGLLRMIGRLDDGGRRTPVSPP